MGITGVEPDRTSALVIEVLDAPQVVALARASTDVQILTVDPVAAAATWFGSLPPSPSHVVADVRAVRALLAVEAGRAWLSGLSALSLALPAGEEAALLLQVTADLEGLGLRVEHIEHVTTTIAVVLHPSADVPAVTETIPEQLADAYVRAAAEANLASDAADRARRDEALALAQLRTTIERNRLRMSQLGPRRKRGRWARAVRHPVIATRRVLGRVKRLIT